MPKASACNFLNDFSIKLAQFFPWNLIPMWEGRKSSGSKEFGGESTYWTSDSSKRSFVMRQRESLWMWYKKKKKPIGMEIWRWRETKRGRSGFFYCFMLTSNYLWVTSRGNGKVVLEYMIHDVSHTHWIVCSATMQ